MEDRLLAKYFLKLEEVIDSRIRISTSDRSVDNDGYVKRLLTWASIAYACGFVTVTLYTWRVGLPVIELLHPIYVWIGLPLAVFAFFFEHIARAFRKRIVRFANEIRQGWSQIAKPENQGELNIAADVVAMLEALPFSWLLRVPINRVAESLFAELGELEKQKEARNPEDHSKAAKRVRRVRGLFRVLAAMNVARNLVSYAALICAGLFLYVWVVYPKIPQSLGGGRPSTVTLVAEATALPKDLRSKLQPGSSSTTLSEKETVSLPVSLLYLTKDAYYVQTESGARMSIKADAVKSVIWIQPMEQPPPSKGKEPAG